MAALSQIHEVEDIFLEARATKAHTRLQELVADTRVVPDRVGNLIDVRARCLTDRGERIDGGDALREHCICSELGELG